MKLYKTVTNVSCRARHVGELALAQCPKRKGTDWNSWDRQKPVPTLNLQLKIICCAYTFCPELSFTLPALVPAQHSRFSPVGQEGEGCDNVWVVQTLKCSKLSLVLLVKHPNELITSGGSSVLLGVLNISWGFLGSREKCFSVLHLIVWQKGIKT